MEADCETRDRCYHTNCLGPGLDTKMRSEEAGSDEETWQTSPGDLEHVTMSDDVTSTHDNVRSQGHSLAPVDI